MLARMTSLFLIAFLAHPAVAADAEELYAPGLGPHRVSMTDVSVINPATQREIPVRVYCPESEGTFPVIVFSHGAGDGNRTAPALMHYWASWGYVVVLPKHAASEVTGLRSRIERLEKEFDLINIDSAQAWNDRIGEAKAVIDAVEKPKSVFGAVATHMNSEKIGMSGHSLGARTTMLLAGTALFPEGAKKALDFSDTRIDAALLLSAIGTNGKTVTKDSWKNVTVPMMVMSGSRDSRTRKETGEWRTESYQFAPNGDKYLVFLEGADHLTYIGPMRSDEPEDELPKSAPEKPSWFAREFPGMNEDVLFTYVRSASLAFWDAYLKDDAKAKAYLRGSALATFSDGLATLEHK